MKKQILILPLLFSGLYASSSLAQDAGTLKKIAERKIVVLGVRETPPFAYKNGDAYIGYSVDLCLKAVDAIKAELKLPSLKVEYTLVDATTRFGKLVSGDIDLECGSTTNSVERQKKVSFSNTFFVANVKAVVKDSSPIKSIAELNGKTVASTTGTTSIDLIKSNEKSKGIDIKEVFTRNDEESFNMVKIGKADVYVMDDILIADLVARSGTPKEYRMLPEVFRSEPYGIMMRKGDTAFKAVVDKALNGLYSSGEINKIYAKWFEKPIPPKNINLNFPQSKELKDAFKNPNDKGV